MFISMYNVCILKQKIFVIYCYWMKDYQRFALNNYNMKMLFLPIDDTL